MSTPSTAADRAGRNLRLAAVLLLVVLVHGGVMSVMGTAQPLLPSGRGEAVAAAAVTVRTVALAQIPESLVPEEPALAIRPSAEPALRPSVPAQAAKNTGNKVKASVLKPAPILTKPEVPVVSPEPQLRVSAAPDDGPAPSGPSALPREALRDLPSYSVSLPPSQHLRFKVRRGDASGHGVLDWARSEGRYQASLRLDGEALPKLEWTSQGETEPGSGVAPQRMVTHRRGRPAAAANFMLEQQKATFSGARVEQPFVRGGQDRITWMLQLAGVFNARAADASRADEHVLLYVVGPRGSAELWNFKVLGLEMLDTGAGEVPGLRLVREAERLYDTRIDIWLDPARHHLPLKWRQQQHGATQLPLEWERIND
jgi:Protein of unknown function (DUF3108)